MKRQPRIHGERDFWEHGDTYWGRRIKSDYWDITEDQVVEKTGKPLSHWMTILKEFKAETKKSNEAVAFLQNTHNVPPYSARTFTTRYL